MNWLFEIIIRLWRVNDNIPSVVNVIVPVTYGLASGSLATGSIGAIKMVAKIYEKNSNESSSIAFAVSATTAEIYGSFEEYIQHHNMLQQLIPGISEVCAGAIYNTIHEAREIRKRLSLHPTVVVVTGPGHSRRARLVWKRECPDCDIRVVSFSSKYETQGDHSIITLRGRWRWLLVNMALHFIFLMPFGYAYFSKNCEVSHQPVRK